MRKVTSTSYTLATNTVDFFIYTAENQYYGKVKFFLEYEQNAYVLFEEYVVIDKKDHFFIVKSNTNLVVRPINIIFKKFIYMKLNFKEIIVARPNSFETN